MGTGEKYNARSQARGVNIRMFWFLFAFARFVIPSKLDEIDPYSSDPAASGYLYLGCSYWARNQSRRYETESVQRKVEDLQVCSCFWEAWPGCTISLVPEGAKVHHPTNTSFKRGDPLISRGGCSPLNVFEEGHYFHRVGMKPFFIFYNENKPPMRRDVLKRLPWPKDKDLLAFRNSEIEEFATAALRKQSQVSDAVIILDKQKQSYLPFAQLRPWIRRSFRLDKFNPIEIDRLIATLARDYPDVKVGQVYKTGSMTRVIPRYRPYTLIPPMSFATCKYDPETFSAAKHTVAPTHSTIIAEFMHQGSLCCILLEFDILSK